MELARKHGQGVINIIRFNWHFYLIAGVMLVAYYCLKPLLPVTLQEVGFWLSLLAVTTIVFSLFVSYYVYDLSGLYQLPWLPSLKDKKVLNINAGFDETSSIIRAKYPSVNLVIGDFYDPVKHTEVSIRRARRAYPLPPETVKVSPAHLPFQKDSFDCALAILSAHEIRDELEAVAFFEELRRITNANGRIYVTEHLRDTANFMAYTVGFLHFYSRTRWLRVFERAGLTVLSSERTTPFILTFTLSTDGITS